MAARAALWAGDAATARRLLEAETTSGYWGPVLAADRVRIAAGISALEGHRAEALDGFMTRDSRLRAARAPVRGRGSAVDMVVVLPDAVAAAPAAAEVVATARATLTRLGAAPFLARLDGAAAARKPAGSDAVGTSSEMVRTSPN